MSAAIGKRAVIQKRALVRGALFLAGAYLFYTAARSWVLLGNSRRLISVAQKFPREYSVGSAAARKSGERELVCVVLGDSTAAGVGAARLPETLAYKIASSLSQKQRVRVVNLAVSGAHLSDVLSRQIPQLQTRKPALKPDWIFLSIGANDATARTPSAQYQNQIAALISQLAPAAAEVLWANTPDMGQTPALPWPLAWAAQRRARRQNILLQNEISQHENLKTARFQIIDLYGRGQLIYRENPNLYAADFFHPSPQGYEVWARLFIEKLELRN